MYICSSKPITKMTSVVNANSTETIHSPRLRHGGKMPVGKAKNAPTPESELMSVDDYFNILHRMVDEYYDSIQG